MSHLLTASHLTVTLGGRPILNDLSFAIERGSSVAIIGPNGSGKTTLLRSLMGTVPYSGTIGWSGPHAIGYVPQKIDADRHLPVTFRNLLTAKAAVLHLPASAVVDVIVAVGLAPAILETPVGHLSGGQFQRGLMAFATLGTPDLLLLDEPTASIDRPGEEHLYELVHRLQQRSGATIILVSHDLGFVYRYATTVLSIGPTGISLGPPQTALSAEALERLYGAPARFPSPISDHA